MNASISPDTKSHSVFFHREFLEGLEGFLKSYWLPKTVFCAVLLSLFFSFHTWLSWINPLQSGGYCG